MHKNFKKFFLFSIFFFLLSSCGGWDAFEGAVTGQKKSTTDEYLIKNKDPLILPPDYTKLPLPKGAQKEEETNKIETILADQERIESNSGKSQSDLENIIQKELRKKN